MSCFGFERILTGAVMVAASILATGEAVAQSYPEYCHAELGNKPVTLVVGNKPGGGYDTYARSIAPVLSDVMQTRVSVTNMPGGGGMLAMSFAREPQQNEIILLIDGMIDLISALDGTDALPFGSEGMASLGIVYSEPEVWLMREDIDLSDPNLDNLVFSTSSLQSNFIPMVMVADVLGLNVDVVAGYGGSSESIEAILRGETDVTTASLTSASRGARSGDLSVKLLIADKPHPAAAGVPTLLGERGMFDVRNRDVSDDVRAERRDVAETIVALASSQRTLFTSSYQPSETVSCLRQAIDATLVSPDLKASLAELGRPLVPHLSDETQDTYANARSAFAENADLIAKAIEAFGN